MLKDTEGERVVFKARRELVSDAAGFGKGMLMGAMSEQVVLGLFVSLFLAGLGVLGACCWVT